MTLRRAIFFDRDGTLNEEVHYLRDPAQLRLYAETAPAIRLAKAAGWLALVVTNQSAIARGLLTEAGLHEIHQAMQAQLTAQNAALDAFYFCPHLADAASLPHYRRACACRKPQPGMLLQAAQDWGIDLARSCMIGDRYLDVATAHAAGAQGVLVQTGYGKTELTRQHEWPQAPQFIADNVLQAVEWLVQGDAQRI